MALQRNPIAGGAFTYKPNTLWQNNFAIATSSKAQSQDGLTYYAGETGGSQYIVYSTKAAQGEAYPGESTNYTPVAWGSFGYLSNVALIELTNGLPGRAAGTQYTTIDGAINALVNAEEYFIMNQDYPFVHLENPLVIWDPSIPSCSWLGQYNSKTTFNLGNSNLNSYPIAFAPQNENEIDFSANGGTAYGKFQANTNSSGAVMTSQSAVMLNSAYPSSGFVVSVWFRHSNISSISTPCPLFSFGNYVGNGFILGINASNVAYGNSFLGNYAALTKYSHSFSSNQWNNVTLVFDPGQLGNEFALWINGASVASFAKGSFDVEANEYIQIGGNTLGNGGVSNCDLNLIIGNTIIDNLESASYINYNYEAYRANTGINGKY